MINFDNKTDWKLRSEKYEDIKWVSKDETLDTMLTLAKSVAPVNNILDLGTGTGKVINKFKEYYSNANYYGIDLSEDMMEKIDDSLNVHKLIINCEDLSNFDDNFFDIVTARMSMHHVDNLSYCFNEVYRVLRNGGRFIICEGVPPNNTCHDFYVEMFKYKEERHTFSIDDLTHKIYSSNFDNIELKIVYMCDMSLNNWLNNADITKENIETIRDMHLKCDQPIKKAYNMKLEKDDIIMDWKFIALSAEKL